MYEDQSHDEEEEEAPIANTAPQPKHFEFSITPSYCPISERIGQSGPSSPLVRPTHSFSLLLANARQCSNQYDRSERDFGT